MSFLQSHLPKQFKSASSQLIEMLHLNNLLMQKLIILINNPTMGIELVLFATYLAI